MQNVDFAHGVFQTIYEECNEECRKAIQEFEKDALNGDMYAQYYLGFIKYFENNDEEAVKWYTKSSKQDLAIAKYGLGNIYYQGNKFTRQNYRKAFKLFEEASKQGLAVAQSTLSFMYRYAEGVNQDYTKSFEWALKAALQGNVSSMYRVSELYEEGLGVEQSNKKASEWHKKACRTAFITKDRCEKDRIFKKGER